MWQYGKKILLVGVLGVFLAGCGTDPNASYVVNLEVWGVFDDSDAYQEVFTAYRDLNPHVANITYRKMPIETYKQDLVDALAAGNGPDIFMIRNVWTGGFADKMTPAPDTVLTVKGYQDVFPDVAVSDFVRDGKIYAAPTSVDSLALYYNKDLFNAAGIARAPTTWEEVTQITPLLTRVNTFGGIDQAGIALGTVDNINRSTDLLTALMYQKSGSLLNAGTNLNLNDPETRAALEFYQSFADGSSPTYSWNNEQHYSLDAFSEGTLAMMINYSWHYQTLKQKNAKLNIGVAPLPQFAGSAPQNQANYWAYGVAKNKDYVPSPQAKNTLDQGTYNTLRSYEAWQFLKYFTMVKKGDTFTLGNAITGNTQDFVATIDPAETYLTKTKKPAARRDLINAEQNTPELAPFASGNLIAKNWFSGNAEAAEAVLAEFMNTVYSNRSDVSQALGVLARRLQPLRE